MNDWTSAILLSTIQVTAVAVAATMLVLWVGRCNPSAAASTAVAALVVTAALTLAALAPLPQVWTWSGPVEAVQAPASSASSSTRSGFGAISWDVGKLLSRIEIAGSAPVSGWNWRVYLASALVACSAVSVGRWLVGWILAGKLRRNGRLVKDADMLALVADLRTACGIGCRVELRESAAIGSAATCGGWRPAILLARDWRSWSADDRRAVLAHEMAHVRRRDFGWGVAAGACLAINAYHPLVRWLAGRLRLAQELAADRFAASCAGGSEAYRRALARMALRQDQR